MPPAASARDRGRKPLPPDDSVVTKRKPCDPIAGEHAIALPSRFNQPIEGVVDDTKPAVKLNGVEAWCHGGDLLNAWIDGRCPARMVPAGPGVRQSDHKRAIDELVLK